MPRRKWECIPRAPQHHQEGARHTLSKPDFQHQPMSNGAVQRTRGFRPLGMVQAPCPVDGYVGSLVVQLHCRAQRTARRDLHTASTRRIAGEYVSEIA